MAIDLSSLTNEEQLVLGLRALTKRDLVSQPPQPKETMQAIGISATNLDRTVRSWINDCFRAPAGKPLLISGSIKPSTKWADLVALT